MTTRDVLVQARALIEDPERWCPKGFGEKGGRRCAVGALIDVTLENGCANAVRPAQRALGDATPCGSAMAFNDNPSTTHADIMALFDKAIAAEDAKTIEALDFPTPAVEPVA